MVSKKDKKYELTNEVISYPLLRNCKLYRIRALKTFQTNDGKTVNKGDLGGYISNEACLSHKGNCWVGDKAKVAMDDYRVKDVSKDCVVTGNALVCGNAVIENSKEISGNCQIRGNTTVILSKVSDNAVVRGNATVINNSFIRDNSCITGDAFVETVNALDSAKIDGKAIVRGGTISDKVKISGCHLYATSVSDNVVIKDPLGKKTDWAYHLDDKGFPRNSYNIYRCKIKGNAQIIGKPRITESVIEDKAMICDEAEISKSQISGNAVVSDRAKVLEHSKIGENATISKNAEVTNSVVKGNAVVSDVACVRNSILDSEAQITGNAVVFDVSITLSKKFSTGKHTGSPVKECPVSIEVSLLNTDMDDAMIEKVFENLYYSNNKGKMTEKLARKVLDLNDALREKTENFDDKVTVDEKALSELSLTKDMYVENGLVLDKPLSLDYYVDYNLVVNDTVIPTKVPGLFLYRSKNGEEIDGECDFRVIKDELIIVDAKEFAKRMETDYKITKMRSDLVADKKLDAVKSNKKTKVVKQTKKCNNMEM